jgi:hypothetical protein
MFLWDGISLSVDELDYHGKHRAVHRYWENEHNGQCIRIAICVHNNILWDATKSYLDGISLSADEL